MKEEAGKESPARPDALCWLHLKERFCVSGRALGPTALYLGEDTRDPQPFFSFSFQMGSC